MCQENQIEQKQRNKSTLKQIPDETTRYHGLRKSQIEKKNNFVKKKVKIKKKSKMLLHTTTSHCLSQNWNPRKNKLSQPIKKTQKHFCLSAR